MRSSGLVGRCCTRDLWRCSRESITNPRNPKAQRTLAADPRYLARIIVHPGPSSGSVGGAANRFRRVSHPSSRITGENRR
jgi:hypothetical protein